MWLYGSNLILIRKTQHWLVLHSSPLLLRSRVLGKWPSYRHHHRVVRTSSPWGHEDDINGAQSGSGKSIPLRFWSCLTSLSTGLMQKLFQPPLSNQLLQMTPQSSTVFHGVPSVLMVLAMKALVVLHGVFSHFIWPFEE